MFMYCQDKENVYFEVGPTGIQSQNSHEHFSSVKIGKGRSLNIVLEAKHKRRKLCH